MWWCGFGIQVPEGSGEFRCVFWCRFWRRIPKVPVSSGVCWCGFLRKIMGFSVQISSGVCRRKVPDGSGEFGCMLQVPESSGLCWCRFRA